MTFTRPEYHEDGTCLQGYVGTTYAELKKAFGKPTYGPNVEGDKTTCEWVILFNDTTPVCIYDWKVDETDFGYKDWNIGGNSKLAIAYVKEAIRNSK
jgi:hypothetical protein